MLISVRFQTYIYHIPYNTKNKTIFFMRNPSNTDKLYLVYSRCCSLSQI